MLQRAAQRGQSAVLRAAAALQLQRQWQLVAGHCWCMYKQAALHLLLLRCLGGQSHNPRAPLVSLAHNLGEVHNLVQLAANAAAAE